MLYICSIKFNNQTNKAMAYSFLGFTDRFNTCDCCGRTDLKRVYVLSDENENETYFGMSCGAKALLIPTQVFKKEIKVKEDKIREGKRKKDKEEFDLWLNSQEPW